MVPTAPSSSLLVVASLAVHALAFTALGHGRASATESADRVVGIELGEAPAPVPVPVEEAPAAPEPAAGHHHDYPVPEDHDAHPHDPSLVHAPLPSLVTPHATGAAAPAPEAAAPAVETTAGPARFAMTVSNVGGSGQAQAGAAAGSPHGDEHGAGAPLPESGVSTPARALGPIVPVYPASARAAEVEADVVLQIVVSPTGEVRSAEVTRAAGYGLDAEALRAVRTARFAPAQRDGHPVAVRMRWTVAFRLR